MNTTTLCEIEVKHDSLQCIAYCMANINLQRWIMRLSSHLTQNSLPIHSCSVTLISYLLTLSERQYPPIPTSHKKY